MLTKYYVPFTLKDNGKYEKKIAIVFAVTAYQAMLIVCGTYVERDENGDSVFSLKQKREAFVNVDEIMEIVDFTTKYSKEG
jgi:hypothetical protein